MKILPCSCSLLLSVGVLLVLPARAADSIAPSGGPRTAEQAQQLLKDRDEAQPKAKTAEKTLRENGWNPASLGFEEARGIRDREAASGSKVAAYNRYAKKTRQLERSIQSDVEAGRRAAACLDIARFERLQAEVDLARVTGQLPEK